MVCLIRLNHFRFFKGSLLKISLGLFLNTLLHVCQMEMLQKVTFFGSHMKKTLIYLYLYIIYLYIYLYYIFYFQIITDHLVT